MIKTLTGIITKILGPIIGAILCAVSGAYLFSLPLSLALQRNGEADLGSGATVFILGVVGFLLGAVFGAYLGSLVPQFLEMVIWTDDIWPQHRHEIAATILGLVIGCVICAAAGSLLLGGGLFLLYFALDLSNAKEIAGFWGAFVGAAMGGLGGLVVGPVAGLVSFRFFPRIRRLLGLISVRGIRV